jgi:hypothetical protein
MHTVRNSAKDRSKAMHRVERTEWFEYGWESKGRTRASGSVFTVVGAGSMDEAIAWMGQSEERLQSAPVYREFDSF